MKKLLLALLLSTSLFARVEVIEESNKIKLYCIDGYVFLKYNVAESSLVQMYIARQRDGIPVPRQCTFR